MIAISMGRKEVSLPTDGDNLSLACGDFSPSHANTNVEFWGAQSGAHICGRGSLWTCVVDLGSLLILPR